MARWMSKDHARGCRLTARPRLGRARDDCSLHKATLMTNFCSKRYYIPVRSFIEFPRSIARVDRRCQRFARREGSKKMVGSDEDPSPSSNFGCLIGRYLAVPKRTSFPTCIHLQVHPPPPIILETLGHQQLYASPIHSAGEKNKLD